MTVHDPEKTYRTIFNAIDEGLAICRAILDDAGRPCDYRFLEINESFARETGLTGAAGKTALELVPDLEKNWIETYGNVALTGSPVRFEQGSKAMGRWFDVYAFPFGDRADLTFALLFKDITQRKEAEERLRFLAHLNHALQIVDDPDEVMQITARMLGDHLGVNRCAYAEVHEDQDTFTITGDYNRETFSIVGEFRMSAFGAEVLRLMRANEPYVVNDVDTDPRVQEYREAYDRTAIQAVICVPLRKKGRFAAAMAVHQTTPRRWSEAEVELVHLVVQRSWESIERARTHRGLRESERRFREMADNAPVMMWITDFDGVCTFLSKPWYDFTGQTPAEGLGFGWLDAVHPEDRERSRSVFLQAQRGHVAFRHEYRLRRADGEYRWAIDSATPRFDTRGEYLGYIGSVIEISEQKEAQEALRRSAEALREADRLKDEFLATLSHELRTPLTSILGWAQMIGAGHFEEGDVRLGVGVIARSAKAQAALIEDVLDISRITTGKMRLDRRPSELREVIEAAVETVAPAAEAKEIALHATVDPALGVVSVDPDRIQQVVWNLLSNAIKFTPSRGAVTISAKRSGGAVEIVVSDNGIGVPRDFLPHIFERFRQADSSSRREQTGLGLGLALTKDLVEMHGGTVRVESEQGHGARFTVTLPVPQQAAQADETDAPAQRQAGGLDGRRLLVVDDDPDARQMFVALLRHSGAEVLDAASVDEGIRILERFEPHLVVTDIAMPGRNGYEFLEVIRDVNPDLPVVAVTAQDPQIAPQNLSSATFSAYLTKPVEVHALLDAVTGLLR